MNNYEFDADMKIADLIIALQKKQIKLEEFNIKVAEVEATRDKQTELHREFIKLEGLQNE